MKLEETLAQSAERTKDHLEWAWGIIANAGGGDWSKESKDWQEAAAKWRDAYFGQSDPPAPESAQPKPWQMPPPPEGQQYHNPDKLTDEQVGEGYRLLLPEELDGRFGWSANGIRAAVWDSQFGWDSTSSGNCKTRTYRVPADTPFPETPKPESGGVKIAHVSAQVIRAFQDAAGEIPEEQRIKVPTKPTGKRYASVDELVAAECSPEVQAEYARLKSASEAVTNTGEPQPDPYEELKAAHRAGKTIQITDGLGGWVDLRGDPSFLFLPDRYRIKPDSEPEPPKPDADGWIPWNGGECPVGDDVRVEIRRRGGDIATHVASYFIWHHWRSGADRDHEIVAYRVVKPTPDPYAELTRLRQAVETNTASFIANCPPEIWQESAGTQHIAVRILSDKLKSSEEKCEWLNQKLADKSIYASSLEQERASKPKPDPEPVEMMDLACDDLPPGTVVEDHGEIHLITGWCPKTQSVLFRGDWALLSDMRDCRIRRIGEDWTRCEKPKQKEVQP